MGTMFKMTPKGVVTTIHNFSELDGHNPDGGLVLGTDGNFYGTTRFGGPAISAPYSKLHRLEF